MDQGGGGGCCIARYAGGSYDMSKVDRIMLRFRPIAPKPATNNSSPSSGGSSTPENSEPSVKTGRGKRRRPAKDGNVKKFPVKRRKASPENTDSGGSVSDGEKVVKTLPLLPEAPDVKETPKRASKEEFPLWMQFGDAGRVGPSLGHVGLENLTAALGRRVVVESWVKVECVTETWTVDCYGWYGLGRTDEEKMMSLDIDTCPGFVSDGMNRVRWTNAAYRKETALPVGCAAFTCRVRVVTCGKEKSSKTVPCDVWKMDCGGFAWRLDTTAALSLGRLGN
ncbi:hypothetical protein CDL12_23572 [Handroanthus impetiginosus]|uniref:DUF7950 domain-containing protein n=1 Tax=Handroanthus impetiginosus TaxID=429701 RepID=A0A2G9GF51_9LAMI|nr:hypothetical protein CDL12_23572 [Handroanthus impetiginosus]